MQKKNKQNWLLCNGSRSKQHSFIEFSLYHTTYSFFHWQCYWNCSKLWWNWFALYRITDLNSNFLTSTGNNTNINRYILIFDLRQSSVISTYSCHLPCIVIPIQDLIVCKVVTGSAAGWVGVLLVNTLYFATDCLLNWTSFNPYNNPYMVGDSIASG